MRDLADIEALIVEGNTQLARARLRERTPPTEIRSTVYFASLLRRVGLCAPALQVLHPFLFPDDPKSRTFQLKAVPNAEGPTNQNRENLSKALLEYALNLSRLGGGRQAIVLLNSGIFAKSSLEIQSQALYAKAVALATSWDYENAKDEFASWLDSDQPDNYTTAIGHLNYANCCLRLKETSKASVSIEWLLQRAEQRNWTLVHANTLELQARLFFQLGMLKQCRHCLEESKSKLNDRELSDRLHLLRLEMALACTENETAGRKIALALKKDANALGHFETIREIDLFFAVSLSDCEAAKRVFYGSPYPWFRNLSLGREDELQNEWPFFGKDFEPLPPISAKKVKIQNLNEVLGVKDRVQGAESVPVLVRLLEQLASDFYRPWSMVALHIALFPERIFHPLYSPSLIRSHLARLRKSLIGNEFVIEASKQGYKLKLGPSPVLLRRPFCNQTQDEFVWKDAGPFSLKEFAQNRGLSERSALRVLVGLVSEGKVHRTGKGPATRYAMGKPS